VEKRQQINRWDQKGNTQPPRCNSKEKKKGGESRANGKKNGHLNDQEADGKFQKQQRGNNKNRVYSTRTVGGEEDSPEGSASHRKKTKSTASKFVGTLAKSRGKEKRLANKVGGDDEKEGVGKRSPKRC